MYDFTNMAHDELVKRNCNWHPEAFEVFWAVYPLKYNKVDAMRVWDRLRLPESEFPAMMSFAEGARMRYTCENSSASCCLGDTCDSFPYCEYYNARIGIMGVGPADRFLLDQPWVR